MTATETGTSREFGFEDRHFELLRTMARAEAGIELNDSKRELVYGRLARRLRQLGLSDFDQYCELVGRKDSPEVIEFINSITTNVTSFFREDHHFEQLRDEVFPYMTRTRAGTRRLRIWSAACSSGQEPYSIGITAEGALPDGWDLKILATDIDRNVVARAESALYPATEVAGLAPERRAWFEPANGPGTEPMVKVSDAVRRMIHFRPLNLMDPWPMSGPLDVIFCRNVVIYFSESTQRTLFQRFSKLLAPDGYLFIGHSESMLHSTDLFRQAGRTVYRPVGAGVA